MTILVFGRTGQVARELAAFGGVTCLGRAAADLADPSACAAAIRAAAPRAVINAAAWTAVDAAEADEAAATVINGEAPGAMARECAARGIPLVSISTDYVFDGSGTAPWRETDLPAPVNAYGRSKLAGERAIAAAGGTWAVLRTSWVFSAQGANFVRTMLRLGAERDRLRVVADQIGGPTPADAIAAACVKIAETLVSEPEKGGIYHFSGAPDVSWAGFARETFARAGLACTVEEIATADWPTPAARPLNSRLDCSRIFAVFGMNWPDWHASLGQVVKVVEGGRT